MLTWEWTTKHATAVRSDWAGRFWYSFYEKGAIMADFCQRALAYMTRKPLEDLAKKKTPELKDELLRQLHAKPWLLILDGLERVLVAYHRVDAAEIPDEEANAPIDKIANRNPCDAACCNGMASNGSITCTLWSAASPRVGWLPWTANATASAW